MHDLLHSSQALVGHLGSPRTALLRLQGWWQAFVMLAVGVFEQGSTNTWLPDAVYAAEARSLQRAVHSEMATSPVPGTPEHPGVDEFALVENVVGWRVGSTLTVGV